MKLRYSTIALVASCFASGAGSARQRDVVDCLWANLHAGAQDAMFANYRDAGADGIGQVVIDNTEVERLNMKCVRHKTSPSAVQLRSTATALAGYALSKVAARLLLATEEVKEAQLLQAWRNLSAQERSTMRKEFLIVEANLGATNNGIASGVMAKVVAAARASSKLGLQNSSRQPYFDFYIGLAQAEAFESRT